MIEKISTEQYVNMFKQAGLDTVADINRLLVAVVEGPAVFPDFRDGPLLVLHSADEHRDFNEKLEDIKAAL